LLAEYGAEEDSFQALLLQCIYKVVGRNREISERGGSYWRKVLCSSHLLALEAEFWHKELSMADEKSVVSRVNPIS
jgi:hypothetical protein